MFVSFTSPTWWVFNGLVAATLLLVAGCSQSSNPVGYQLAADENLSAPIPVEIPQEALESLRKASSSQTSIAAASGENVVTYTFDDLDLACHFNVALPSEYHDLEFSDSRLIGRCASGGGVALLPTDLASFNSGTTVRNLIALPAPAIAVSIEAFDIRELGPRSFVAYDADGNEIDRASYVSSAERVQLTVTGAIHQVGIIDFQAQTFWDNLTVTYGDSAEPPVADAGSDQQIIVTETATLSGAGSSSSEGAAFTYAWTWVNIPDGSEAAFSDPASAVTSFTADLPGTYTAQLVVSDGSADSTPDEVVVTAMATGDAIAWLRAEVSALQESGGLSELNCTSLLKKLDVAQSKADDQPLVALNVLKAFTNHVSGLVRGGMLSREQGDALIGHASRIAVVVGSSIQTRGGVANGPVKRARG